MPLSSLLSLPSIQLVAQRARRTFARFPETLLTAFVCAGLAFYLTRAATANDTFHYLLVLSLAIPLSFAMATAAETRREWGFFLRTAGVVLGAAFLVLFEQSYLPVRQELFWLRFWQFSLGFHLLVAFSPFVGRGSMQGFWQYNRELFERFLTAALYSGTLQVGLSIGLWGIKSLLGIHVGDKAFLDLWILMSFVFNTWFFLAGVPADIPALDADDRYPPGIKFFTQYVLLPLVTIYFVILYLYVAKIVGQRVWPRGTIGYLVSVASVLGIFSLLLMHPLRESGTHRWIKVYSKVFYAALYPLIVTLLLAVWKRTDAYGLTEKRYFLFVIAAWLTVIATYFTFSRRKNIKIIPVSLCLLTFATAAGPWSAYGVSRRWQQKRLGELFQAAGAFEGGKIRRAVSPVPEQQVAEMSSILDYLGRLHGFDSLQPWFNEPLKGKSAAQILELAGLSYQPSWRHGRGLDFYFSRANQNQTVDPVTGFDWLLHFQLSGFRSGSTKAGDFTVALASSSLMLSVVRGTETIASLPLQPLLVNVRSLHLGNQYNIPAADLTLSTETERARVKIIFQTIQGTDNADRGTSDWTVSNAQGDAFIGIKTR